MRASTRGTRVHTQVRKLEQQQLGRGAAPLELQIPTAGRRELHPPRTARWAWRAGLPMVESALLFLPPRARLNTRDLPSTLPVVDLVWACDEVELVVLEQILGRHVGLLLDLPSPSQHRCVVSGP